MRTATHETQRQTGGRPSLVRVLVVDDHPILRQGLARMIDEEPDMVVCGEAEDAPQALEAMEALDPGFVIVDISLKGRDGLELVRDLKARWPHVPSLVFSMYDEGVYAERALRAGAGGYLMKQEAIEHVLAAIRTVLSGQVYLSPAVASRVVRRTVGGTGTACPPGGAEAPAVPRPAIDSPVRRLTDRELEVFRLLGHGLPPRRIAERLFRSIKTVEAHRENIKAKLGLRSSGELIRFAAEYSLRAEKGTPPAVPTSDDGSGAGELNQPTATQYPAF